MRTLSMVILLAFLLLLSYGAANIHCAAVSHGNRTDVHSLLEFKAATNDPTGALRSWDRRVHYCNWTGVVCSYGNPGRVAGLELGGESLSGEITPSLGNLTYLMILNLSSNGFSGQLPSLNQLHELVVLDLSNNSFHGIIPDSLMISLMNCSNLEGVDLSRNMLEGPIPEEIGSLYNLIGIGLSRNNLTGVIPPSISNATQLQLLNLRDNQLGGSIPAELGRLSNIRYLIFGGNMLNGHIPASLGNATKLQVIDLSQNSLVGEIPSFGKLQSLNKLHLEYNNLEGVIP